jgi:mannose-6-phosphate isomerase-like protein (cupin superfamily)
MALQSSSFIPASVFQTALTPTFAELPEGKTNPESLREVLAQAGVPIQILVDKNIPKGGNEVEVHRHEADLWIGIDGAVHFEVGGAVVNARIHVSKDGTKKENEIKATDIAGGTIHTVAAGDILYIPAGQPHRHFTDAGGGGRLWIIKIPARDIVPLESVPGWKTDL